MVERKQPQDNEIDPESPGLSAGRPATPGTDYGVPKSKKGLLPWSHVSQRMAAAKYYWISTVSPRGRPHATPVDGIWLEDQLYFSGSPSTRRNRNLAANPAVCIHLENGLDVVILHGDAHELRGSESSLGVRLYQASMQKYGYGTKPEGDGSDVAGVYTFSPRVVFAWKEFPNDVTRWRIPDHR